MNILVYVKYSEDTVDNGTEYSTNNISNYMGKLHRGMYENKIGDMQKFANGSCSKGTGKAERIGKPEISFLWSALQEKAKRSRGCNTEEESAENMCEHIIEHRQLIK